MTITPAYEKDLTNLDELDAHASAAEVVTWNGRRALRLTNGLVVMPGLEVADGSVGVQIGAEAPAYPGIAFRIADALNYELAYAQPHTSGLWDALQYDPVFHGSNTWQLYHGRAYQKQAVVPTGEWFSLRVDVKGDRAAFTIGDQPPLVVGRLAHRQKAGLVGIWSFQPAYFSDFRVSACQAFPDSGWHYPAAPAGVVGEWFLEGFGTVECEPSGILNLNRYLPLALGEVRLVRWFEVLSSEAVEFAFGFSDELSLQFGDQIVFTGRNTYASMRNRPDRGYVDSDMHVIRPALAPGTHRLTATLKVTEPFGWGLILSAREGRVRFLPANKGGPSSDA
ncbi:MAG: hypothetical protein AB1566_00970 [Chloroflexota bacterium]